jgi:hypothetical protein
MASIEPQPKIHPAQDQPRSVPSDPAQAFFSTQLSSRPSGDVSCSKASGSERAGETLAHEGSLFRTIESTFQSWPATLRVALLMATLLSGMALVLSAMGVVGQLLLAGLGYQLGTRSRRE